MATPTYQGADQPAAGNGSGLLGRLGSLFGGETPAYSGDGQPSSSVGVLGRVTPAYAPGPTQQDVSSDNASAETQTSCPIDPEAIASGHIAIVIPRQWDPCRDEQAATD
jgi:hypothetical protein